MCVEETPTSKTKNGRPPIISKIELVSDDFVERMTEMGAVTRFGRIIDTVVIVLAMGFSTRQMHPIPSRRYLDVVYTVEHQFNFALRLRDSILGSLPVHWP
jgi:hypothetical protein